MAQSPLPADSAAQTIPSHDDSSTGTRSRLRSWMRHDHTARKVNENELLSLKALIAYAAYTSNQNEFSVERTFVDHFSIPNVTCLPTDRYDEAIRYLVDKVEA